MLEELSMNRLLAIPFGLILLGGQALVMSGANASDDQASGLVIVESAFDVATTADRFAAAAEERGLTVFARIDHAAGAAKAGMDLPPTELLIFGTAKVGTPLMECDRRVGIDLPLKTLIWMDESGQVLLGYNSPDWLAERHGLGDCSAVLAKIEKALAGLAADASGASEDGGDR
jgi:uncharacterized protein (DUF302 family)